MKPLQDDELTWFLGERSKAFATVALVRDELVKGSSRDAPGLSLVLELDGPDRPWVGVVSVGYLRDASSIIDGNDELTLPIEMHGGSFPVLVCAIEAEDGLEGRIGWIRKPGPSGKFEVVTPTLEPMTPKAIHKLLRQAQAWAGTVAVGNY